MVYVWNRKMRVVSNGFLVCTERFNFLCRQWHEFRIGEANGTSQWMRVCASPRLLSLLLLLLGGGWVVCWVLECCRYSVHKLRAILFRCGNKEHIYIDRNDRMRTSTTHTETHWIHTLHRHQPMNKWADEHMHTTSVGWVKCNRIMPPIDTTWLKKIRINAANIFVHIPSSLALWLTLSTNFLLLRPLHCFSSSSSSNCSEWIQLKSAYELKALPNWI